MKIMGRKRTSNFDLPPRMHRKGEMYYYVQNNPRKWIKLSKDISTAKAMWAQYENANVKSGEVGKAISAWYLSARFEKLAVASKIAYNKVKDDLIAFFGSGSFHEIKPAHIAQWLDNHKSPVMANLGRAVLSNVFNIAVRQGHAERNPCKDMPGLKVAGRTRYITHDEFIKVRDSANDLVRICMDICYLTSLRIQDILSLKTSDIRSDGLYVIQHKTQSKQKFELTDELRSVLDEAKALPRPVKHIEYLLCTRQGKPYSYSVFNAMFWMAKKQAKIEDMHFHDIRAKSATDAKEQGLNYQALLGHASIAMSEKYIRRREFVKTNPLAKKL